MVCPDQYQHMLAHALEVQARRQLLVEVLIQVHAAQQRPRRPPARMARVQAQEHAFLVSIVSAIARCRPSRARMAMGHGPWIPRTRLVGSSFLESCPVSVISLLVSLLCRGVHGPLGLGVARLAISSCPVSPCGLRHGGICIGTPSRCSHPELPTSTGYMYKSSRILYRWDGGMPIRPSALRRVRRLVD